MLKVIEVSFKFPILVSTFTCAGEIVKCQRGKPICVFTRRTNEYIWIETFSGTLEIILWVLDPQGPHGSSLMRTANLDLRDNDNNESDKGECLKIDGVGWWRGKGCYDDDEDVKYTDIHLYVWTVWTRVCVTYVLLLIFQLCCDSNRLCQLSEAEMWATRVCDRFLLPLQTDLAP